MTRRIVFAGGVQAKALAKAYRLDVAESRDEDVFFIGAESIAREAAHRVVAAADVVVTDTDEHSNTVPDSLVPSRAVLVGVPVIHADFLWPFAAGAHPANRGSEALPDGPYPVDFGDSHLDTLLAQGIEPDEAVRQYVAADLANLVDLDAMRAAAAARLAMLDARTGFDLASLLDRELRDGHLFASRHRMRLGLFRHVAAQVFGRAGADPARAHALQETHFPAGEMPIHPSVLRHFGMTQPPPDHRYPVLDEGTFTFEEYCQRYVRFAWNERLHEALALAETYPAKAIPMLRRALEQSPDSAAGQAALAQAERAVADRPLLAQDAVVPSTAPAASQAMVVGAAHGPALEPQLHPESEPRPASIQRTPLPSAPLAEPSSTYAFGGLPSGQMSPWPTAADARPMLSGGSWSAPTRETSQAASLQPSPATGEEQQAYVELPLSYNGHDVPAVVEQAAPAADRYTPLPPAQELIEVLPRMLPSTRGLSAADDGPFAAMAESMPPPPLRPVLPPEIHAEPARRGLLARLFGGGR